MQLASLGLHLCSKWIRIDWPSPQNRSFEELSCAEISSWIPLQQSVSRCPPSSRFARRPPDIYSSWIWLNSSQRSVVWIIYSSISWILLSSNLLSDLLQMLSCLPGVISAGILTLVIWLIDSVRSNYLCTHVPFFLIRFLSSVWKKRTQSFLCLQHISVLLQLQQSRGNQLITTFGRCGVCPQFLALGTLVPLLRSTLH